ncbi:MAG: aminotransferase class V-fold PLP-dependent enzyme [Acidobacteria bacterium]|nr:aminotransferase class V-fold PLP-dependent enzyme [Acidobacteriota bacterium]
MSFEIGAWLEHFPVRERFLYLDHAALAPLPRPVAEAMRRRIEEQELGGDEPFETWRQHTMACRHLGAQLIGCAPEDISLIANTSQGLSLVAEGLGLGAGDEVLVGEEEFAANVAPWLHLERLGVRVVRYPQPDGTIHADAIEPLLTARVKVLTVSWVAFHTGWIAPLDELAALCKARGIFLVVDAIQGLGALQIDMRRLGADAVIADGHKWLLGPEGQGLMALSPRLRDRMVPVLSGWRNVRLERHDFFLHALSFLQDGRRFEPGSNNGVGLAGLAAALDLLSQIGADVIAARIEMLSRLLTRILIAHGWELYSPGSGHPIAGIVAGRPPQVAPRSAVARLRERHVICSVRQGYVRLSPHFYVTKGEMAALDRILEKTGL